MVTPREEWRTNTGSYRVPGPEMEKFFAGIARLEERLGHMADDVEELEKRLDKPLLPGWAWGLMCSALMAIAGAGVSMASDQAVLKVEFKAIKEQVTRLTSAIDSLRGPVRLPTIGGP